MVSHHSIEGLLSVVIPTFGRSVDVVSRAVRSVQGQTFKPIEVLVVDDNPSGHSLGGAIRSYCQHEERVRYIKTTGAAGACAARNAGILEARGQWIGFLDDDDTWEPEKAEIQLESLNNSAQVGMVFCKGIIIDESGSRQRIFPYWNDQYFKHRVTYQDLLIIDCIGTTSQAIMHKKCLEECGNFNEEMVARQDYELWLRISKRFPIVGVNEFLFKKYMHKGEQISKSASKTVKALSAIFNLYKSDIIASRSAYSRFAGSIAESALQCYDFRAFVRFFFPLIVLDPRRARSLAGILLGYHALRRRISVRWQMSSSRNG